MKRGNVIINDKVIKYDCVTGQGLQSIFDTLAPRIGRYSKTLFIQGFDSQDIKQELEVAIWQGLKAYKPGKGKIVTWLITCIDNRAKSLISTNNRSKDIQLSTNHRQDNNTEGKDNNSIADIDNILKSGKYKLSRQSLKSYLIGNTIVSIHSKYYPKLCYETVRRHLKIAAIQLLEG